MLACCFVIYVLIFVEFRIYGGHLLVEKYRRSATDVSDLHTSAQAATCTLYTPMCISTSIHACIHTYIHTYVHTYIHTYIHTTLHYITLHYITLHYITLHYTTLHYTTLHYITLLYFTLLCFTYIHSEKKHVQLA